MFSKLNKLKRCIFILLTILICKIAAAQDSTALPNSTTEQQLENLADADQGETEDDSYLQQLDDWKKNPLNINAAIETDLKNLLFLTPLQIQNFLLYRQTLGLLISIYELQAVPGWNLETIQKLKPYIYVGNDITIKQEAKNRFLYGKHSVLLRSTQILEKSQGYIAKDSTGSKYLGSPQHIFLRYRYKYKNNLQYGIAADKDAGEQFFKGAQKKGFDFYSFHLFAKNIGAIKNLALGDFTVNMGQGLISWQALAFHKSVDVMNIKRQAQILRPYNSAGEFNFHRGAGITLQFGHVQTTAFVSYKNLSANAVVDSINYLDYVSSILTSGYHRTSSEIADMDKIKQLTLGGNISYDNSRFHLGVNAVHYSFNKPLQKSDDPYNKYAISGKKFTNASADYSYTLRNMHIFGEVAVDQSGDIATVDGMMMSLDTKVDFSLLYRNISRSYTSLYSNAFTEASTPINENGFYTGIELRPWAGIRIDAYADVFSFPWLKYGVDRPSKGSDYLVQLTWKPNKQIEVYTRYVNQTKASNLSQTDLPTHITMDRPKQNWRTNISYKVSSSITLRGRTELIWFDKRSGQPNNGFLMYADVIYKPMMKPFSANLRLQYFETDSYDSRLYAYENDVQYSFSIPPFSGKGYRWYLNFNYDVNKKLSTWLRIAQSIYPGAISVGSGYDEIDKNHKTELKLQLMYNF